MANILDGMTTKVIGYVTICSGLLWIGDPAHVIHAENENQVFGQDWDDFTDKVLNDNDNADCSQFKSDKEFHGICVPTTHGDGTYEVVGIFKQNMLIGTLIDFDTNFFQ